MARKCHRQEIGTHFIFFGEQFLGEGCPGALNSKEFRALVICGNAIFAVVVFERLFRTRDSQNLKVSARRPSILIAQIED